MSNEKSDVAKKLEACLGERILIIDGAMGTMIQGYKLGEADYRGERFADWHTDIKGNNDLLVLTRPAVMAMVVWIFTTYWLAKAIKIANAARKQSV